MLERFLPFAAENPMLLGLFFGTLLLYLGLELKFSQMSGASIGVKAAAMQMNRKKTQVIDLRSAEAFAKRHILGALNCPLKEIDQHLAAIKKTKASTLILIDEAGTNCRKAYNTLKADGFEDLMMIEGGIRAWQQENLPVVSKES